MGYQAFATRTAGDLVEFRFVQFFGFLVGHFGSPIYSVELIIELDPLKVEREIFGWNWIAFCRSACCLN